MFAATEILEKIRAGEKVEDIVKGAFRSVVKRVVRDGRRSTATLVMTGGVVAHNPILVRLIEESFGRPVLVPPEPSSSAPWGRPCSPGNKRTKTRRNRKESTAC